MRLLLLQSNLDIIAEQEEKYSFVISVAKGDFIFDEIKKWIEERLQKSTPS